MSLLSNSFKFGKITIDKNYCMTNDEIKNIDPSLYPNVFPIWNTDDNCLYMMYKQDNGEIRLSSLKNMEWTDNPAILYPTISNGILTWELRYLSASEEIPEVNITGKSAYEVWKDLGNEGSEEDFINSLKGKNGVDGEDGVSPIIEIGANGNWYVNNIDTGASAKGDKGDPGNDGIDGENGKSAYEVWKAIEGNEDKTIEEFLESLKGEPGNDGINGINGEDGVDGLDGKSAYEVWKDLGNEGSEEDFIASLKGDPGEAGVDGEDGTDGINGKSAYEVWKESDESNADKTVDDFLNSLKGLPGDKGDKGIDGIDGENGKSAYEVWKAIEGNEDKTEEDFFNSLKGEPGEAGKDGVDAKKNAVDNYYNEIVTDPNIIFDDDLQHRLTYFLSTISSDEEPPVNARIINLGWINGSGLQLAITDNVEICVRYCAIDGNYGGWVKFIHMNNLNTYLNSAYVSKEAETTIINNEDGSLYNASLPTAFTSHGEESITEFFKEIRSGFYTVYQTSDESWYNAFILKHKNGVHGGAADNYGIMIFSSMDKDSDLKWNQLIQGVIKPEKILLDSTNYSKYIQNIDNRLMLKKGSYVTQEYGTEGEAGYINFARITIKAEYANYPCILLISGRGRTVPMLLSVNFTSVNNTDPELLKFYRLLSEDYDVFIYKSGTSQWDLYAPKNGADGRVDVLNVYTAEHYEISYPNVQVTLSQSTWQKAQTAGNIKYAHTIYDSASTTYWNFKLGQNGLNYGSVGNQILATASGDQAILPLDKRELMGRACEAGNEINFGGWRSSKVWLNYKDGVTNNNSNIEIVALNIGNGKGELTRLGARGIIGKEYSPVTNVHYAAALDMRDNGSEIIMYNTGNSNNGIIIQIPAVEPNANTPSIIPGIKDKGQIGGSNVRWNQFHSVNALSTTSDRNEKENISYIGQNSEYITFMSDETLKEFIRGFLPVIYNRINGESGRPHHGFIAQDIEELLQKLEISDHAGFIKSPKTRIIEVEKEVEVDEKVINEETGEEETVLVAKTIKETKEEVIEGEYVYSLRYEEFIADIVRFIQLQDKEIDALKHKVIDQDNEINDLKTRLERLENLLIKEE